jgi:outer membrane receptor for ferrienterochelin and colicins
MTSKPQKFGLQQKRQSIKPQTAMKKIILLLCLLVPIAYSARSQENAAIDSTFDLSLEQLMNMKVITASKVAEKVSDAPGIISTISSREIEQFGGTSLIDILDRVTGVVTMGFNTNPQNAISFRGDLSGESNNHTLVLINGRPNRESIYGGIDFSIWLGIPLTAIERIEIIRGPGSVLYGSNAFSGVVNIILKKGGAQANKVSTYAGAFGGVGFDGYAGFEKDDLNVTVGYKNFEEKGWKYTATDMTGVTDTTNFGEKDNGITLSLGYKGLTVNSLITESTQTTFGFGPPIWFGIKDKTSHTKRTLIDVGYEVKYSDKVSTKVNATVNNLDITVTGPVVATGKSNDILAEISNFIRPTDRLNIVVGGTVYKQTGELPPSLPRYNKVWYNAYLQADYRPIEPLKLIAGFQVNKIEGVSTNVVPRFGAIYQMTEKLGAKVLYGQAFRAAYGVETNLNSDALVGNKNLKPETLENLDLQFFYTAKKLEFSATYFNNSKEKNIIQEAGTFINAGVNKAHGLELEGKFVPNTNFYVSGSYAYQTNELRSVDGVIKEASLMPNHIAKLGVGYQTKNGISLGLYNIYISKFNKFEGQDALLGHNGETDGFNILSANLSIDIPKLVNLDIKESVKLSVFGSNLLDESVSTPEFGSRAIYSMPGRPGRAVYVSLSVAF